MQLTGAPPDDAAVLVFAGLGIDAPPPSETDPPPAPREVDVIDSLSRTIRFALEERLSAVALRGDALLDWVCRRDCILLADPGWIEARFALNTVSTEIRRARLDLNPGYQAWLGLTVMIVYE
jgi:hypothetical protein